MVVSMPEVDMDMVIEMRGRGKSGVSTWQESEKLVGQIFVQQDIFWANQSDGFVEI